MSVRRHPRAYSLEIKDDDGDKLSLVQLGGTRSRGGMLCAEEGPRPHRASQAACVSLGPDDLRALSAHAMLLRRNALNMPAGMLDIVDVLAHTDTELGAMVRTSVADGHELTLVIGETGQSVNVEMPCEACDKAEPNRDDCAACGDEPAPVELDGAYITYRNLEAHCIRLAGESGGPKEAAGWTAAALLARRGMNLCIESAVGPRG